MDKWKIERRYANALSSAESLVLSQSSVEYVKLIENYVNKKKNNRNIHHDSEYDGLSAEQNCCLYQELTEKMGYSLFSKMPGCQYQTLVGGRELFNQLPFEDQIKSLTNCIDLFKSGRSGGCDLSLIGGKSSSGVMVMSANLSACKAEKVYLTDCSPAGIHSVNSVNLMELLK